MKLFLRFPQIIVILKAIRPENIFYLKKKYIVVLQFSSKSLKNACEGVHFFIVRLQGWCPAISLKNDLHQGYFSVNLLIFGDL